MSRVSGQHYPSYGLLKQGPHKVRLPTGRRAFPGRKGSYLIARARRMNLYEMLRREQVRFILGKDRAAT